jgi:biotin operon repressor
MTTVNTGIKQHLIRVLTKNGPSPISELEKELEVSNSDVKNHIEELKADGMVIELSKPNGAFGLIRK